MLSFRLSLFILAFSQSMHEQGFQFESSNQCTDSIRKRDTPMNLNRIDDGAFSRTNEQFEQICRTQEESIRTIMKYMLRAIARGKLRAAIQIFQVLNSEYKLLIEVRSLQKLFLNAQRGQKTHNSISR